MEDVPVDPMAARLWLAQGAERDTAVQLLQKRVNSGVPLAAPESRELRKVLASLINTLAAA